jgi:hypothetical protein
MEKNLIEVARLIRMGLFSLNLTAMAGEIEEKEDDFEGEGLPGYIEFSGVYVYPKEIDVVTQSILGTKRRTVNGFIVATGRTYHSFNRDIPDDYDVVPVSEHEHANQAAYAAVLLFATDRLNAAFEADCIDKGYREENLVEGINS